MLAWITSAKGTIENREVLIKLVFKQNEEGFLQVYVMQVNGVEALALDLYADKLRWQNAISNYFTR